MTPRLSGSARGVGAFAQRAIGNVQRAWGDSPFYQSQLNGPTPDRFLFKLPDPYAPSHEMAEMLVSGQFTIFGQSMHCEGELESAFDRVSPGEPLYRYIQGFQFLRPLSAIPDKGAAVSTLLVKAWLDRFERWDPATWEPGLTGSRLTALVFYAPGILAGCDVTWRSRLLSSIARQTRHLELSGHRAPGAYNRLAALFALCLSAAALPRLDEALDRGLEMLRRELRIQLRPDGGHVSRNPSRQLAIVNYLKLLMSALSQRGVETPGFLRHLTARASVCLGLFRVSDGRLATFNGGYEDDPAAIMAALPDETAGPIGFVRHSGFQRLDGGKACVIADVGGAQPANADAASRSETDKGRHDGGGAFQFTVGRQRLIVNCGAGGHLSAEWRQALRQAAAHSTLSRDAGVESRTPIKFRSTHRRAEDARGQLLEIERHAPDGAIRHMRRLFLACAGDMLRGEDILSVNDPQAAAPWRLRFHLHPAVRASLARDGRSAVLAAPNSDGWRFRANAPRITIEKSVYCGAAEAPRAGQQIVISLADMDFTETNDIVVKWALRLVVPDGA